MRHLIRLSFLLLIGLHHTTGAESGPMRFEAIGPQDSKPAFAAGQFGQGLECNYQSFAAIPGAGFIRNDCGTIELKVKLARDLRPYSEYRVLVSIPPEVGQKFTSQLGILFTPEASKLGHAEGGLVFTLKNKTQTFSANAKGLAWKAGSEHSITATWGPDGMLLYIDGQLAAQDSYKGGFLSENPALIQIGRHASGSMPADIIIDELKISDIQRDATYVAAEAKADRAPQSDANTTVLMHFDGNLAVESTPTSWRANRPALTLANPREFGINSTANNVYYPGEDVAVDAMLFNGRVGASQPMTITAEAKDMRGRDAATATMTLATSTQSGWQSFSVPLPLKGKIGWYSVRLTLRDGDKSLSTFDTPCLVIPPPPKSHYEFGLDCHGSNPVPWATMKRLGMTWARPHNNHWNWHLMETVKGQFDFSRTDADIAGTIANGVKLLPVLGLAPEWASVPPDNAADFKGGENEWKMNSWKYNWRPGNLEDYRNYVTKLVERYKGKVQYWEHYNEPDWHLPNTAGFAYGGTTEQFVEQMKVNYETIKKIDPNAKLVFPGIACHANADPNFVRDVIRLGGLKYCDVVGMHSYGGYPFFAAQIELFRKAGYTGEIWQTEKLTSRDWKSTVYEDIHILQIPDIVEALALGVTVYIAHPQFNYFKGGSPQPESFTVPFFFHMVGERTYSGRIRQANVFFFDGKEGPLVVCWSKADLKLQVGVEKVQITDLYGESAEVESPQGVLTLKGSPEARYITSASGQPLTLAKIDLAAPSQTPVLNGDFEELDGDAGIGAMIPKNWKPSPSHNKGTYVADTQVFKSGKASLRQTSPKEDKQSVIQDLPMLAGRTYELSCWIRTESATPKPGNTKACVSIWSRTLGKELGSIADKDGNSREFRLYTTKFTVPADSTDNAISCFVLAGTDKAWFDVLELKEVRP